MAKKRYNRIKEVLQEKAKTDKAKTQGWLAEKLGVDYVTINRYANNHNQPPIEVFAKIASILGVKIKDLIND